MKILPGLAAVLACLAALAAPPMDEQKFRELHSLDEYRSVIYRDASGATITYDEFAASAVGGKAFTMTKNPAQGLAVFAIQDKPTPATPAKYLVKRGERLPDASLRDLEGRVIELHSRGGRPLLMSFFFAECAPCVEEIPALNAFAEQRKDVDVASITFDDPATARKFVAKYGLRWPIVPQAKAFLDKVGIKSYPAFAYVGRDGRVLGIASASRIGKADLTPQELAAWMLKLEAEVDAK